MRADFIPHDKSQKPLHFDCVYEREAYPEDVTEQSIELNAAPATRRHMLDFLAAIDSRGRPVADIEEGHISTASCILANVAMELGRTSFHLTWWSCVFPNTGFILAMIEIGKAIDSQPILWVGSAATCVQIVVYLCVLCAQIRAVYKGQILWPGKDEDHYS